MGNYDVAIVFFDRALKIDFNYVPALVNKGGCLEKLGNHEDAQELFDRAKQLDPTYKLFDGAKNQSLSDIGYTIFRNVYSNIYCSTNYLNNLQFLIPI